MILKLSLEVTLNYLLVRMQWKTITDACPSFTAVTNQGHARSSVMTVWWIIGRPERRNGSSQRPYILLLMFFPSFFSPRDLRAPSADRRETLPHDRNLGALYNASPKICGPPRRNWGPKHAKFGAISDNFNSIANISGMGQDI